MLRLGVVVIWGLRLPRGKILPPRDRICILRFQRAGQGPRPRACFSSRPLDRFLFSHQVRVSSRARAACRPLVNTTVQLQYGKRAPAG